MKNIILIIAYAVVQFHSINTQINIKQISTDDKKPSGQFKIPTAFLILLSPQHFLPDIRSWIELLTMLYISFSSHIPFSFYVMYFS